MTRPPPRSTLFPTRRSSDLHDALVGVKASYETLTRMMRKLGARYCQLKWGLSPVVVGCRGQVGPDRKSTRLNSSHPSISYAVFCLKKKKKKTKRAEENKQRT